VSGEITARGGAHLHHAWRNTSDLFSTEFVSGLARFGGFGDHLWEEGLFLCFGCQLAGPADLGVG